jgi:hypothetical protein
MFSLPALLLAAAPVSGGSAPAQMVTRVSVEIVRGERVAVQPLKQSRTAKQTDRQYRRRDKMPMVEFF